MRVLTAILGVYLVLAAGSISDAQSALQPVELLDLSVGDLPSTRTESLKQQRYDQEVALTTQIELLDPSEELQSDEPDAAANGETRGDADEEDDRAFNQATLKHLELLRRPVGSITLTAGVNQTDVPVNLASELDAGEPVRLVTGSGAGPLPPDRYSVCFMHQPLYYEDANLERCGIGHGCWQTACSGTRFLADTLFLAYKMGRQHPDVLVCSRGDCKSCQSFPTTLKSFAPRRYDARGVLSEAAALAGFSLLLL